MTKIEDKLFVNRFKLGPEPHIKVKDKDLCLKCQRKQCSIGCPSDCWKINDKGIAEVNVDGCLECGTCRVICDEFRNVDWKYPQGGFGILYRHG